MLKYWIEPNKFDKVFTGFILPGEQLPYFPEVSAEEYLQDIARIAEEIKRQAINSKPLIIKPKKFEVDKKGIPVWSEGLIELNDETKPIRTQKAKTHTRQDRRVFTHEDVRVITAAMYMKGKDFNSEEDRLLEITVALAKADEIIENYDDFENET